MAKKPEQLLQIGVFDQLRPLMHLQNYSKFMAFQIRNETGVAGAKGAMIGAFAKAMGTMEGASDTLFLFPESYLGFGLEYPATVFVEYKSMKPLKTKKRDPESLLSPAQEKFKKRVEYLGFDYWIIAATDVQDALKQTYAMMQQYGVKI